MSSSYEQRASSSSSAADKEPSSSGTDSAPSKPLSSEDSSVSNSNLVFGYLNLFSDSVVSLLNTLLYHSRLYDLYCSIAHMHLFYIRFSPFSRLDLMEAHSLNYE
jgi:hypothetical protein